MSRTILGTFLLLLSVLPCEAGFLRRIDGDHLVKGRHGGLGLQLLSKLFQSTDCEWCDVVMTKVVTHFEQDTVEREFVTELKSFCDGVSSVMRTVCRRAIDQYRPVIVDYVLTTLSADNSCVMAELCPDPTPPFATQSGFLATVRRIMSPYQQAEDSCEKCHFVLNTMNDIMLAKPVAFITSEIEENVCHKFRFIPHLSTLCSTVTHSFVSQAVAIMKKELDPTILCIYIDMCVMQS